MPDYLIRLAILNMFQIFGLLLPAAHQCTQMHVDVGIELAHITDGMPIYIVRRPAAAQRHMSQWGQRRVSQDSSGCGN